MSYTREGSGACDDSGPIRPLVAVQIALVTQRGAYPGDVDSFADVWDDLLDSSPEVLHMHGARLEQARQSCGMLRDVEMPLGSESF